MSNIKNMKTRISLSKREKILCIVLMLVLFAFLYNKLVISPTTVNIAAVNDQNTKVEDLIIAEQTKLLKYAYMQGELDTLLEQSGGNLPIIPNYDNINGIMTQLNTVLLPAGEYNITFEPIVQDGNIARRTLNMTFTAASYDTAMNIVDQLMASPYFCQITSVAVAAQTDGDIKAYLTAFPVTTSLTVTYLENAPNLKTITPEEDSDADE